MNFNHNQIYRIYTAPLPFVFVLLQVIGYGEHEKSNPANPSTNGDTEVDDIPIKSANQIADETDAANQGSAHSKLDQSESRVLPQDEGVSGACIADIRTFKQDLSVLPISKMDR